MKEECIAVSSSWPCGVFGRALNADNKNVRLLDDCRFINKVLHLNWKWFKGEEGAEEVTPSTAAEEDKEGEQVKGGQ